VLYKFKIEDYLDLKRKQFQTLLGLQSENGYE
jgi:hypothetical protein